MAKRNVSSSPTREVKKLMTVASVNQTNILNLNDDCLRVVFSHMRLKDLCALKETCLRFGTPTDEQFQRRYRHGEFTICPEFDENLTGRPSSVLRNFGYFIFKLIVRELTVDDAIECWRDICENCTRLQELSIYDSNLKLFKPQRSSMYCGDLDSLRIVKCFGENLYFGRIIRYFGSLKHLTIRDNLARLLNYGGLRCSFLRYTFPQLREIIVEFVHADRSFNIFFRKNPQLKKIVIKNGCSIMSYLDDIANCCQNIESISMSGFLDFESINLTEKIAKLGLLNGLKELQLDVSQKPIASMIEKLAEKNSLHTLGLTDGMLDTHSVRALQKLSNLTTLKLVEFKNGNVNALENLLSQLQLKHIHIIRCVGVQYEDVAGGIKRSSTLETVTFVHIDKENFLRETQFLQLANARRASTVASPLEFFQTKSARDGMVIGIEQIEANAGSVKLSELDSLDGYILGKFCA